MVSSSEKEFNESFHRLDRHFLTPAAQEKIEFDDLGMMKPFIATGLSNNKGMLNWLKAGTNRMVLQNKQWSWKVPLAPEPVFLAKDCSNTDFPGRDGQTFKIKMSRRVFGHSAIIAASKYSQVHLMVTDDPIIEEGDGAIYTVKMVSGDSRKGYPKMFLKEGTKYIQIGSFMGSAGKYNDVSTLGSAGYQEFYNYIGEGRANVSYEVDRDVAHSKVSGKMVKAIQDYRKVVEMYMFKPGSKATMVSPFEKYDNPLALYMKDGMSGKDAEKEMMGDIAIKFWIPEVEALAALQLKSDVENMALFGTGGTIEDAFGRSYRLPVGLIHYFNAAPQRTYNIDNFNVFSQVIGELEKVAKNKGLSIDPDSKPTVVVGCGDAAWELAVQQITADAKGALTNVVIPSDKFLLGNNPNDMQVRKMRVNTYEGHYAFYKFERIEGLDPQFDDDVENPVLGKGYRLSSYTFMIDDIEGQNDNIVEVVYGGESEITHYFKNGRMNYMDAKSGGFGGGPFAGDPGMNGFQVFMEAPYKAYWVKDTSRIYMVKPINPYTGKAFMSSYY